METLRNETIELATRYGCDGKYIEHLRTCPAHTLPSRNRALQELLATA